jgi:CheY-like chemotaxis protein
MWTCHGGNVQPGLPPLRILVVDDNVDAADMLAMLLESMGHHVERAHDGLQALACFETMVPDLAILDLGLPEIDGFTLAKKVREQPRFSSIPLVALSGYAQPEDIQKSFAAGFTYHLAKPAELERITEIIDAHRAVRR